MANSKWDKIECSSSESEKEDSAGVDGQTARLVMELTEFLFLKGPEARRMHLLHIKGTDRGALAYVIASTMPPPDKTHNLNNYSKMMEAMTRYPSSAREVRQLARFYNEMVTAGGEGEDAENIKRFSALLMTAINTLAAVEYITTDRNPAELFSRICSPKGHEATEMRLKYEKTEYGKNLLLEELHPIEKEKHEFGWRDTAFPFFAMSIALLYLFIKQWYKGQGDPPVVFNTPQEEL
eukprot:GEMP01069739.1.p1 GENE.GEMP01069739.1~~GEMP01069739.1.p1  ORF type:complete len:244 (+),score=36.64 GEMP01069739.1:22-732(+)